MAFKILSIDGGGIRGIIPAIILQEIEKRCQKPISQLFNLIAGTSTGGLIALGLVVPDEKGNPKYTAEFIAQMYQTEGPKIFSQSIFRNVLNVGNFLGSKYPSKNLYNISQKYLGDTMFDKALANTLITSYDIHNRSPFVFKTKNAKKNQSHNFKMCDIAYATAAAPTYFPPIKLENKTLIDGGVYANNPSVVAIVDTVKHYAPNDQIVICSLGTGQYTTPISESVMNKWGLIKWVPNIIDVVFDGISDAVDYQSKILSSQYFRFQAKLDKCSDNIDDTSKHNIENLKFLAQNIITSESTKLDELVDLLI